MFHLAPYTRVGGNSCFILPPTWRGKIILMVHCAHGSLYSWFIVPMVHYRLLMVHCAHGSIYSWFIVPMVHYTHGSLCPWFNILMVHCAHGSLYSWFIVPMVQYTHGSLCPFVWSQMKRIKLRNWRSISVVTEWLSLWNVPLPIWK